MAVARRRRRPLAAALVAGLTAVALAGCRPLYLPPVPAREPTPAVARLGDASALRLDGGRLVLHVVLAEIPRAGWLDVQWFAPNGSQAADDSVWVAPADVGQGRTLTLPPRVALSAGEWRAVTSLRGQVLRQFRLEVGAGPTPRGSP